MSPGSTIDTEPSPKPPEAVLVAPGARLTLEQLREWLDRKPPAKAPDEREWEEFEYARGIDPQAHAGHA